MNTFTTIAVVNRAPMLTDLHTDEPLLKINGFDPDQELPLIIHYRGDDAAEKAAMLEPPALLLVIGEVQRSARRAGLKRHALVISAQELEVIPLGVADSLSMSLSWEVQGKPYAGPTLPFLDVDDEGNKPNKRF